ncbi:TetR family transcriptional regulator [Actinoplanes lobatus]|uniref:AcrR family transcriptional regulator n=1 Tax=Actinoplanes lobatus TaxID=113568 RepID=A0A7W7HLK8_9ACTN|nr:TetR family transcriptional regulator [Actinoplanes lobatus]MBB4752813.1 AcrR family transcriptional regulator [Actinoplanes lobatus]GGN98661.1 TetR family transcriptional regulator [Actinoplanes lobatus]GIE46076.1 TetR family transcriptional regulator [Actinoplanes lobatus]
MASLRDRKRARTRQALVEVAAELFERQGYDETTVAQIAAGAEIGTRTFFSYFPGKEHLVFPESDDRVHAALEAIDRRTPEDGPAEVLLRALRRVGDDSDDMSGRLAALRLRLIREVPAVQGLSLRIQLDAQRQIAAHLAAAFPERLDEVRAAALTGAFVGAVTGALQVLLERAERRDDPAVVQRAVQEAVDAALAPWFSGAAPDRSGH